MPSGRRVRVRFDGHGDGRVHPSGTHHDRAGDGAALLVLDAVDEVTHETWSHIYAAAGSYFTTLTLWRGALPADVSNIGVFVS